MARRNKYGAVRTEFGGKKFDSKKEAARYELLLSWVDDGLIFDLNTQTSYVFSLNGIKICSYRADFTYKLPDGSLVVEDVKSPRTAKLPTYRIKNKLMKAFYGIDIQEVL